MKWSAILYKSEAERYRFFLQNSPYAMLKDSAAKLTGNARYEGFCIDLIEELANHLGFKYVIKEVGDRAYGIRNEKGEWNGMIGELIRGVRISISKVTWK